MPQKIIRNILFEGCCEKVYKQMGDNKFATVIELHLYELFKNHN